MRTLNLNLYLLRLIAIILLVVVALSAFYWVDVFTQSEPCFHRILYKDMNVSQKEIDSICEFVKNLER